MTGIERLEKIAKTYLQERRTVREFEPLVAFLLPSGEITAMAVPFELAESQERLLWAVERTARQTAALALALLLPTTHITPREGVEPEMLGYSSWSEVSIDELTEQQLTAYYDAKNAFIITIHEGENVTVVTIPFTVGKDGRFSFEDERRDTNVTGMLTDVMPKREVN
jgi:hypothetical protein